MNLDKQYQQLLQTILNNGVLKQDRTGIGTKSIFGYQIRHKMSDGFPLLTTKKVFWKGIVHELIWFLNADTNIKYLVDNGVNIWNGDAYKKYKLAMEETASVPYNLRDFVKKIKETPLSDASRNIKTFTDHWGELGPIYGKQWRRWQDWHFYKIPEIENIYNVYGKGSIWHDQIGVLVHQLRINPDDRGLIVNAWNVSDLNKMTLRPCHYGFQCYTRLLTIEERIELASKDPAFDVFDFGVGLKLTEEHEHDICDSYNIPRRALSLMWNQRSVDTFLGLPFNIASYGLLLLLIAKEVNMIPDELIGNLGDTHLYLNHLEQAKEQISRESFELPNVNITKPKESDYGMVLSNYKFENFELINYNSHPAIEAPLNN